MLVSCANAAIAQNGLWTGNDWYDSALEVGVNNGVPFSNDASVNRRISAPLTVDGDVSQDYLTRVNVQRIVSIFDEARWN